MCVPVVLLFALFLSAVVGIFVKIPRLREIFTRNGRQIGTVQAAGDSAARDGLELPIVSADHIAMQNPRGQRGRGRFEIRDLIHIVGAVFVLHQQADGSWRVRLYCRCSGGVRQFLTIAGKYQTAAVEVQFVAVFACLAGKQGFGGGRLATQQGDADKQGFHRISLF